MKYLENKRGLKRKVILGISVILLLVAVYLIVNDITRKSPEEDAIPCCEQIEINQSSWSSEIRT